MPLATVHLIALSPNSTIPLYLRALKSTSFRPLVISHALRWIVNPENLSSDRLLNTKWDLVVITLHSSPMPKTYLAKDWVSALWSITAGIPSSIVNGFEERNAKLLYPEPNSIPQLTTLPSQPRIAISPQGLEATPELLQWQNPAGASTAVSMLNLLAFNPGQQAHESYKRYGKAFAESIGSRRGGLAKIVGKVVSGQGSEGEDSEGWDEVALAHYPSFAHFMDMLASEDYQAVNHRDRLPALRDTCILCTSEVDPVLYADKARL
ncbi:hypothetical protein Q7P37_006466 [Cladosporium fusiforme]